MRLSIEKLRLLLTYDQHSGVLTWKRRARELFKTDGSHKGWNTAHAGKSTGGPDPRGYLRVSIGGYPYLAHHLAWAIAYGEWPGVIDHINRNRADNRIENLRKCSHSENQHNRVQCRTNKSGYKGVSFHAQRNRWRATIFLNSKQRHLGLFDTPDAAHRAYCAAAKLLHADFANFGSPVTAAK